MIKIAKLSLNLEQNIMEVLLMENIMGKESYYKEMVITMKDNLMKERSMAMEF